MFRRIFGNRGDEERAQPDAAEAAAPESETVAEPVTPVAATEASPANEPEAPKAQPLFSRVDELERRYQRTPEPEQQRRSFLRRFFGGEEHTVDEIAREERRTEQAVQKTRAGFFGRVSEMFTVDEPITDELWEELEELLIMADVGVDTTLGLIERVR